MQNVKGLYVVIFIFITVILLENIVLYLGPQRVKNKLLRILHIEKTKVSYRVPTDKLVGEMISNDPLSKYQWNLRIMLDGVSYEEIQGDAPRDVIVAVIDRGVHMNHPDLKNKSVEGFNFIDGSKILRIEFDGKPPNGSIAHGQASASIIAAETNNRIGIAGVFSRAYIMPIQTDLEHLPDAIGYAVDNGAEVIVVAGGGGDILYPMYKTEALKPRKDLYAKTSLSILRRLKESFNLAYENNIPIVAGVGNTGKFAITFFAEDFRIISVAPHNILGEVSIDTSFSYTFEIFAPGGSRKTIANFDKIKELYPSNSLIVIQPNADYDDPICAFGLDRYSFLTLGSGAVPHVAGAIAMIKSYLPRTTVQDIRQILHKSQIPLMPSGSLLEGLAGRISLRKMKLEINDRLNR